MTGVIPSPFTRVYQTKRKIHRREIVKEDLPSIANLLTRGFPIHTHEFWTGALQRLSAHPTPVGFPHYGYLLELDTHIVGALLTVFTEIISDQKSVVRCNLSSWYVKPELRSYAGFLTPHGQRWRDTTFFNITPARHTLPIIEAQGFSLYCSGQFISVPAPRGLWSRVRIEPIIDESAYAGRLPKSEAELLLVHAQYGCLSVICHAEDGCYPFVFSKWRKIHSIPSAYLVYCRDIEDFVRFAGPLGRYLARRGLTLVVLDANAPPPGLVGKFIDDQPKYFKGPNRPRIGDLAYSERALFGF